MTEAQPLVRYDRDGDERDLGHRMAIDQRNFAGGQSTGSPQTSGSSTALRLPAGCPAATITGRSGDREPVPNLSR